MSELDQYGENDNFAAFAFKAKHKAMSGPIQVGNCGKFDQCGENDNFATFANKAKHKAINGPIQVKECGEFGKYGENDNFTTGCQQGKAQGNEGAHTSWQSTKQPRSQGLSSSHPKGSEGRKTSLNQGLSSLAPFGVGRKCPKMTIFATFQNYLIFAMYDVFLIGFLHKTTLRWFKSP